ncbi:Bursicon [Plakobranchus ocellatus]|uniref:Bursicon n=1 Tax=Plakobranchus ocellatus TaxID=259542 RepID=A0AAV4DZD2_9GAST|nr:Bursicon [Plakobranchus ocellatus]
MSLIKDSGKNLDISAGEGRLMSHTSPEQACRTVSRHCYTQICYSFYASSFPSQSIKTKHTAIALDNRQQWTLKGVLIVSISVVLLLALLPSAAARECTLRRVGHTIRWRRCIPKRVLSFVCHGTCSSYSTLDSGDLSTIHRNCNCCKETSFRIGIIRLRCPKPSGRRGYRTVTVNAKIPTGCTCRPCDPLPTIQAAEYLS